MGPPRPPGPGRKSSYNRKKSPVPDWPSSSPHSGFPLSPSYAPPPVFNQPPRRGSFDGPRRGQPRGPYKSLFNHKAPSSGKGQNRYQNDGREQGRGQAQDRPLHLAPLYSPTPASGPNLTPLRVNNTGYPPSPQQAVTIAYPRSAPPMATSFSEIVHRTVMSSPHPREVFGPRPNPHLPSSFLYIDHVPPELPEVEIAQALRECLPVSIRLPGGVVHPDHRIKPNAYYDWMPRSGTLEFTDFSGKFPHLEHTEKALATLYAHPKCVQNGITVSPYPPPLLLPPTESLARYIRPTILVRPTEEGDASRPDGFMNYCPTPGQVFDAIRRWGSLRQVSAWLDCPPDGVSPANALPTWGARVEFWYEDEARRFEIEFGQTASLIKGWQITIFPEQPFSMAPSPVSPYPLPSPAGPLTPLALPSVPAGHFHHFPPHTAHELKGINDMTTGILPLQTHHSELKYQMPYPPSPPATAFNPPWSSHNPLTIGEAPGTPLALPVESVKNDHKTPPVADQVKENEIFPISPETALTRRRRSTDPLVPVTPDSVLGTIDKKIPATIPFQTNLKASARSKQRTWSFTIDTAPGGETKTTGLIADDGTMIYHGPGQHIRPAPAFGPGSTSFSGLVDYANVFVKNLDPDINSMFLSEIFEKLGKVVSARVMRDEQGMSRGYGFVSFETPEEAAHAIKSMNGSTVGSQKIAVTLHEPRKLRPEKIAERGLPGTPTAYGRRGVNRRSMSPNRVFTPDTQDAHTETQLESSPAPGTTDEIRLLSPDDRRAALRKALLPLVKDMDYPYGTKTGSVIDSLVADDLRAIPLLHDPISLHRRMVEITSVSTQTPRASEREVEESIKQVTFADDAAHDRFELPSSQPSSVATTPLSSAMKIPLPESPIATLDFGDRKTQGRGEIKLEQISVDMSALDLLSYIEGEGGDEERERLGIAKSDAQESAKIDEIWAQIRDDIPILRKTKVSRLVAKKLEKLEALGSRPSSAARIAMGLANAEEDEHALLRLTLYPGLLVKKAEVCANDGSPDPENKD